MDCYDREFSFLDRDIPEMKLIQRTNSLNHGETVWDSSLVLCRMIETEKENFENKRIIELGCGIGLPSMVISKISKVKSITVTDYNEKVLELCKENFEANGIRERVDFQIIDFYKDLEETVQGYDVILMSDLLYDSNVYKPLIKTLEKLSIPGRTEVYLSYERRDFDKEVEFFRDFGQLFQFQDFNLGKDVDYQSEDIYLFKGKRRL